MEFYNAVKNSGFYMDGYYVWCGSVIKENGMYYMLAARWKEEYTFPDGYMTNSEIVLAETDELDKPFTFKKVILPPRGDDSWDGMMTHNPYIFKVDNKYVCFYIGTPDGKYSTRSIGYATADRLDGEWIRSDKPITLPPNANNPCVIQRPDGKFVLYFRDGVLKVYVAEADNYWGEYKVVGEDIFPEGGIEDMFVYRDNDKYIMIAEDCRGAYTGVVKAGVKFVSDDSVNFHLDENEPAAYAYEVVYDDGTTLELQRRERPILFFDDDGENYLFTASKIGGETRLEGGKTWNMVQRIKKL